MSARHPHPHHALLVASAALLATGLAHARGAAAMPSAGTLPRPAGMPAAQDPPTSTATGAPTATPSITPTPTATSGTPQGPLPDLRVAGSVSVFGPGQSGCVVPNWMWWTEGSVWNEGDADAGPFVVRGSSGAEWSFTGLAAGQREALGKQQGFSTELRADADEQVVERNEDNNVYRIPIPTLPIACTPTPDGGTPPAPTAARLFIPFAQRPSGGPAHATATGTALAHATATHEPAGTPLPPGTPTHGPSLTPSPTPSPVSGTISPTPTHSPTPLVPTHGTPHASDTPTPHSGTVETPEPSPTPFGIHTPTPTPFGPLEVCPVVAMGWRVLEGVVVDEGGVPLDRASVACYQASDYPSQGSCEPFELETGSDGRFAFHVFLHEGDWLRLMVHHQSHPPRSTNLPADACAAGCPDVVLALQAADATPEPTATFALWPKGTAEAYPRSDCLTATPEGGTPHFPRATQPPFPTPTP